MGAPTLIIIFAAFFLLALPVLMIVALVDLLRHPAAEWKAAGQNQLVWALVVVFVGFIGPILYLTICRSKFGSAPMNPTPTPAI